MSSYFIDLIQNLVALTLAYIPLICFGGYVHAYIASLLGDDTPARNGFLTLSPQAHVEPAFPILLSLIGLAYGRIISVDPSNLRPPLKSFKTFCLFFAGVTAYALVLILVLLIGGFSLAGSEVLVAQYPWLTSYMSAYFLIGLAAVRLALFLLQIELFLAIASAFVYFCVPGLYEQFIQSRIAISLIIFMLILIYGAFVQYWCLNGALTLTMWVYGLIKSLIA